MSALNIHHPENVPQERTEWNMGEEVVRDVVMGNLHEKLQ